MATAVEKLTSALNKTSRFWVKTIEVHAQDGEITLCRCEGFSFKSDPPAPITMGALIVIEKKELP